jgi:ElaA protein
LLRDPDGTARIGRVATAISARGAGFAATLMRHALSLTSGAVVLGAQAYLEQWYGGFGFVRDGADYIEDGIVHLPMRLHRSG